MRFNCALDILLSRRDRGHKNNNLAAVKRTALALGLAEISFKIVHIAGTNGKGTTSQLMADTLCIAGFKTGLFTSPHIYCPTERIKINNQNISKKDLALYIAKVLEKETSKLNFFEILTLASLKYFKDKNIDYAVIETGIGGRLDSTNFIKPVLSIITSIGLDHTALLGNTINKIAQEKGGIIKHNTPCVCGLLPQEAKQVIKKIAASKKSPLFFIKKPIIEKVNYQKNKTFFTFEGKPYTLNLIGSAQTANAALVLTAAEVLNLPQKSVLKAFSKIKIPCRFEVVKNGQNKFIIKDGAHNPQAVKEFVGNYAKSPYYKKDNFLVLSVSKGKDYKSIIKLLKPYFKNVIAASAGEDTGVPAQILADCFGKNAVAVKNPKEINLSAISGNTVILGSFYLFSKLALKQS